MTIGKNNWQLKTLGELFHIYPGGTPSRAIKEYWCGEIPWVKISDMLQRNIVNTEEKISKKGLSNSSAKIIPKGSLLISIFATVGRTAFLEIDAATNQAIVGLVAKVKNLNNKFVGYFLDLKVRELNNRARGVAQNNINKTILSNVKIPFPPLRIQKQITQILEKADQTKQKRIEANKLTDEFLQSIFIEMFGDPVKNPKGWTSKTLTQIISQEKNSLKRGPFGSTLKKDIFIKSGYLVYEQYHALNNDFTFKRYFIDEEKFKELEMFKVCEGDLIVSCSGVYLGKIAEVPKGSPKGIINQALLKITLDQSKVCTIYFKYLWNTHFIQQVLSLVSRGSGIPNFPSMSEVKSIQFPVPPLSLQKQFAEIVNKTEALKEKQKQSEQKLENLFQSLMQRAFKGELNFN